MALIHVCLLLLLSYSACCQAQSRGGPDVGAFLEDPDLEWERMETVIGKENMHTSTTDAEYWRSSSSYGSSSSGVKKLPESVIVTSSKIQKEAFKPEKGSRPLPNSVKEILLVGSSSAKASMKAARPKLIEILCHVDRMYVRVRRELFKTKEAYKDLKLGSCPVNQGTKEHYYFLYLLKSKCGFKKESNVDYLSIGNSLSYKPSTPVVRELPFDIPLQCRFPRFFHSYKVGFLPKLQGGTVFKALQPKSTYTITPQDASGNEITGSKSYNLGDPMFFEAKRASGTAKSGAQRIYVNKCFMTAASDPNSNPKYTVIDNQGCMIDGKVTSQSKFYTGDSTMVQKFSIGAMVFKDSISSSASSQQLYMHCEIAVKNKAPTISSKACNYDMTAKKWKELYGDDSVCTCCESTCSSGSNKASKNLVSSHSWKVDLSAKDEDVDFEPLMKMVEAETFDLEDPDMAEHKDFLNYWEHDY
ncbi:zona pellucida sperm-binding protein 3 [Halichoeres trimaculatus]|uniref:zona pellucida sperm-binding protein 3 n=1 Tax=Halichoeres trimaculatus TaxID=147232 RepID=UPI003D9ECED9